MLAACSLTRHCRQATEQLLREHMGFFAQFFTAAVDNMMNNVEGTSGLRVGQRKRSQRWDARASPPPSGGDYYLVPPERALVPVTVYAARDE